MVGKKILLVDDEAPLVEAMTECLKSHGYEVVTAGDGKEGLRQAVREKPDLILLDIVMPQMDGFEVLKRLKMSVTGKNVPVIMLTAQVETGSILKALDLKATDYFLKPFELEDFLSFIQRYV